MWFTVTSFWVLYSARIVSEQKDERGASASLKSLLSGQQTKN